MQFQPLPVLGFLQVKNLMRFLDIRLILMIKLITVQLMPWTSCLSTMSLHSDIYLKDPYFQQTYANHTYSIIATDLTSLTESLMEYAIYTDFRNGMTMFEYAYYVAVFVNNYRGTANI